MISKNFVKASVVLASSMFVLAACGQTEEKTVGEELPNITAENFRAHVTFLADDTLGGRDTGSVGYEIAANYVASHFKQFNLKPAGDNGTYFQQVPFVKTSVDQEASSLTLTRDGEATTLKIGDDFLVFSDAVSLDNAISGDVIFVGHGVSSADHDDFADIDVTGKIIARLQGAPADASEATIAAAGDKTLHGAAGAITLYTPASQERRPFARLGGFFLRESLGWVAPKGKEESGTSDGINAFMSPAMGTSLLAGAGLSFEEAITAAASADFKPVSLGVSMDIRQVTKVGDEISSPNVAGVLEGSDPELKDEYVIISAHLDHVGTCAHREGRDTAAADDTICNGALDNASGISSMLEAAKAFVQTGAKPRRSIMFLAVTAEEKGLLGAQYFAKFPTINKEQMIANVNLDMPVMLYDFADVVAFGGEHSEMGEIAARATAAIGVGVAEDPMPEQRLFTRSDHYRFVQEGVPSIFLMTGPTEVGETVEDVKERNGYKTFYEFLNTNYHSPADDISQPINWEAGAKFAVVNYLIAKEIANADVAPRWYEYSEFGQKNAPNAPKVKAPAHIKIAEAPKRDN